MFLLGLGEAVRKGVLKREDAIVYEIEKGPDGTLVRKRIELDERGELQGWVSSFSKVERRLLKGWAATLELT